MKENSNIEKFYSDLINQSDLNPLLWDKIEETLSKNDLFYQYNQLLERGALVPPASLWSSIESSLENNALEIQYKEKIFTNAPLPPASLWDSIESNLENNSVETQYEETIFTKATLPPASLWENIESTLENNPIEAQYKETILTNAPLPPASLWDSIESSLENNSVEAQYEETIFTNATLPPASLWDDISGSLSSSSTWERIVHSLNKRDKNITWFQVSFNLITTSLALLMLFYGIIELPYGRKLKSQKGDLEAIRNSNSKGLISKSNQYSPDETSVSPMENNEIVNNTTVSNIITNQINGSNHNSNVTNGSLHQVAGNNNVDQNNQSNNSAQEKANNIQGHENEDIASSNENSSISETNSETNYESVLSAGKQFELEKTQSLGAKYVNNSISDSIRTQFSDYYKKQTGTFFASAYVNNPWINSSRTIQNFTNKTLNYNQLYLTFGAGFGYERFFNKFNLSASLNYNRLGQKYVSYQEGITKNNQITLNYLTLRMCIRPNNKPFYGGVYYGMLIEELYELVDKDYQVNFDKNPEVDHYFKNDFGITMGIEHTMSVLNRPIKFNASLSHSVFSLYTGNMHRDFNKSYNLYLSVGFRYCFK